MTDKKFEFEVGDEVEWCGTRGVVLERDDSKTFALIVTFCHRTYCTPFTIDGRLCEWHTKPSLILINRPKKKVKKTVWVNVYKTDARPDGQGFWCNPFDSEEDAKRSANNVAVEQCVGTYPLEIEVET